MKWYKHDSNANSDAKLRRVRLKYGMEGYGLYWYCLELIAQNVEKESLSFELEHDSEIIAADTGIHFERVQEMMSYMVELGLFEESGGTITCLKLARRCDEYTTKLISRLPSVPTNSGESRDKVRIIRTDKNRTDKKKIAPKKAKRAPRDFKLDDSLKAFARTNGMADEQIADEFGQMMDHEYKDARSDWPAAWRSWVRNWKKWRPKQEADVESRVKMWK